MNIDAKTFNNTNVEDVIKNVSDVEIYGDGDTFKLLCKASSKSQGWMKSTKVCNVSDGCIIQVSTQQKNPDGSYAVAEALSYVPGMNIDISCEPRRLVPINYIYNNYSDRSLTNNNPNSSSVPYQGSIVLQQTTPTKVTCE